MPVRGGRIARLFQLIALLKGPSSWNGRRLAEHFGTSLRDFLTYLVVTSRPLSPSDRLEWARLNQVVKDNRNARQEGTVSLRSSGSGGVAAGREASAEFTEGNESGRRTGNPSDSGMRFATPGLGERDNQSYAHEPIGSASEGALPTAAALLDRHLRPR